MLQVGRYIKPTKTYGRWLALQCVAVIRQALRGGIASLVDAVAEANRTVRKEGKTYTHITKHCEQYGGLVIAPRESIWHAPDPVLS